MSARLKIILVAVAFCVALISMPAIYLSLAVAKPISASSSLSFEVKRGATIGSVARSLEKQQLLTIDPEIFRYYGLLTNSDGEIKAGEYELLPGMTSHHILALFRSGKVIQRQITFPEGWNFSQWRSHLETRDDIKQTVHGYADQELMKMLGKPRTAPEGRFFPDTYKFPTGFNDTDVLQEAYRLMQSKLKKLWKAREPNIIYHNVYSALIAASIIEKETALEKERSTISGVIVRRLKKSMYLQMDPTVIYGVGKHFNGNLTIKDLRKDTPYNTYRHKGLPPTPISPRTAAHAASPRSSSRPRALERSTGAVWRTSSPAMGRTRAFSRGNCATSWTTQPAAGRTPPCSPGRGRRRRP